MQDQRCICQGEQATGEQATGEQATGEQATYPADRMLIATAIELRCPLVTYDERIARFGRSHGRRFGFAVA